MHHAYKNSSLLLHQHTQFQGAFKMKRFGQHALHQSNNQNDKTQDGCDTVVTLTLPFCLDDLDKAIRRLVRKSKLPIRVYERTDSLKTRLVRSTLLPKSCAIHNRFLKQQQQTQKHRGKPCDDCLSCQAGIRPSDCKKRGAIYLLKCKLCSET